jgi:DNA primase
MDNVEEVKQKIDIVDVIGEYVPLKKAGRNYKGLCPFHGEKSPSFMVNPELQIYKCFGCNEGGDVFTFLQKIEGLEFGEVLQDLAKRAGVTLDTYKPTAAESSKDRLMQMHSLAARYYHYLLTAHAMGKLGLEYLYSRGITDELIAKFNLGFAPDGWDFLTKFLIKKQFSLSEIQRGGLAVESKSYDRFRNRIMFPLNNHRGQPVGFAGRIMPGSDTPMGKYINTPETEIYHKSEMLYGLDLTRSEIKHSSSAVIVEGELDAIASWHAGVKNVVAIKGTALTARHVELLRRLCDKVVLALDADLAGNAAARRGIVMAEQAGLYVESVNWGELEAKDVADVVMGKLADWPKMVQGAMSIYSFYIDSAIKRFGLSTEGKSRVAKDVLPFLEVVGDDVRKDEYLKELARKTDINLDTLRKQLGNTAQAAPTDKQTAKLKATQDRRELLEEHLLSLALQEGRLPELFELGKLFRSVFWLKVIDHLKINPDVGSLPPELKSRVQELYLTDIEADIKEWDKSLKRLEEIEVREQISLMKTDDNQLRKLTRRLGELTREI